MKRWRRCSASPFAQDWAGVPEALPILCASYTESPNAHEWGSLFFVEPDARVLVGLGGFKGPPSADAVVEIGYAIAPAFQGQGLGFRRLAKPTTPTLVWFGTGAASGRPASGAAHARLVGDRGRNFTARAIYFYGVWAIRGGERSCERAMRVNKAVWRHRRSRRKHARMSFRFSHSRARSTPAVRVLASLVAAALLLVGCGDDSDPAGFGLDSSVGSVLPGSDAGTPGYDAAVSVPPLTYDASVAPVVDASQPARDAAQPDASGQTLPDAGGQTPSDAGASTDAGLAKPDATTPDAATDAGGGGFVFPDLFPKNDAGTTPKPDGGAGGRDPNGPCKDLNLLCFDFIDMYFNAECFTCNGGKGCQGCAIPFAY